MSHYGVILVATDLSEPSLSALLHAAGLADCVHGKLIVTYVVENRLPPVLLAGGKEIEDLVERHRASAKTALADYLTRQLPGREVEHVVRSGAPHTEIVALAKERKVDLLVIGMHGHGFLSHALSGSTAERVIHHAPCPVLVVPHA